MQSFIFRCWILMPPRCFPTLQMLGLGLTPAQILSQLRRQAWIDQNTGSDTCAAFNPVHFIDLDTVENVRKRFQAQRCLDRNEVAAVGKLAGQLGESCLYYHPQVAEDGGHHSPRRQRFKKASITQLPWKSPYSHFRDVGFVAPHQPYYQ